MTDTIVKIAAKLNKLADERVKLDTEVEKLKELRHQVHKLRQQLQKRDAFLCEALIDTHIEQENVSRKIELVRLELNTQLPYSDLKNLYEITDGPLF